MNQWLQPLLLDGKEVCLEPLCPNHIDGLQSAVSDGNLWELWYTTIPHPDTMDRYIAKLLDDQAAGTALPLW
ncbi:MAG: hypothetical protein R2795_23585 [Saprospiraceae bacterium]